MSPPPYRPTLGPPPGSPDSAQPSRRGRPERAGWPPTATRSRVLLMAQHMSGAHRLLLILHIGFAIFTLGPLTAATMATPRYIRRGDVAVLRYLRRSTQLYGLLSLGVIL